MAQRHKEALDPPAALSPCCHCLQHLIPQLHVPVWSNSIFRFGNSPHEPVV